jgi:putative transposase
MGYKSDLTDAEWALIEPDFRPRSGRGCWRKHAIRTVINAILYGVEWRMMPNDFPPWQTVYDHFSKWNKRGVWETCLDRLVAYRREQVGRAAKPSYGILDAQSMKTVYASEERGIDGGKKVKGHKRHIVVDILGNLLFVMVHAASRSDTKSACEVLERAIDKWPSLKVFSADAGYGGTAMTFCTETLNKPLHISKKIKNSWAVLPKRWVVERTFSWLGHFRRLSKDVEILLATSENMIRIAMLKITLAKCV